ncbi:MAG: hypothetical protein E7317_08530 [Clostridiales bacterium]|nr:hypothetical protein [Clostridiales bacterium]
MKRISPFLATVIILPVFLSGFLLSPVCHAASYPLSSMDGSVIAEVEAPTDLAYAPELATPGDTPEYYFLPKDGKDPLRFVYYTSGAGDPMKLAEMAQTDYAMFYDDFAGSEIRNESIAGRDGIAFSYTCHYPDRSGKNEVYEQTAVGYWPLGDGLFVACIVSLAFDDPSAYWPEAQLAAKLEEALGCVTVTRE